MYVLMNRPHILHELTQIVGLLSRSVIETNNRDFLIHIHEAKALCDTAIQQHTFKVHDIDRDVDDDEL